ncbi:TonB-dependent Receptor Plug Domain protein [bacterium BMS3Abin03]|nr:TonB-dependent Receptor Plug Domain protein [bacterium BMS3Abin03]
MTSMDIITTPGGAADIFQALKTLPGMTQVSESAQLYVRGGDPDETITLLDQASLYHPYTYESAYGGLFSNINTNAINGIFFSSGGFSAKYGNALSGVLELSTKNEPDTRDFLVGLSMASAEISGQIPITSSKLGIRFDARQSFTKPIFWLNGGLDDFTVLPVSSDVNANLIYKYSATGRIKLFGTIANDEQGVNVNMPGYTDEFNGNSTNNLINLQVTDVLFHKTVIKTSLSRTAYRSEWKLGILDLTRKDNGLKLRNDTETILSSSVKFLAGFEVEYRYVNYKGTIPAEDYDLRNNANGEAINSDFNVTRTGAYSEVELSDVLGFSNLYIVGGLRGDIVSPLSLKWLDPRANLGYKITGKLTFTLGWGIFHQHPDPRLYSSADGNPKLGAMKAIHYIASIDYKFNKTDNFRIEAYYKDYKNLPLKDEKLNYNNNGYGFAKGIDVMLKGNLFGIIDGWLSYGLIDTKRKWMDFNNLSSSSFDITHNFTLIAKYNITRSFQVGINYKYATGRPFNPVVGSNYIPDLDIYEPVYGKKNSARYPTYQRLDLRLTYLTQLFNNYFTVFYLEGINILDINNIFGYSYNKDYSQRYNIDSYFGRRTIVFGLQLNL